MTKYCSETLLKFTHRQFTHLIAGAPHENHSKIQTVKAHRDAAKILGRKIALLPFRLIADICLNLILLISKIVELVGRAFAACCTDRKKLKETAIYVVDYACLLPSLPLIRIAEIIKLSLAALIRPKLHYRPIDSFPATEQAPYYASCTSKIFATMLASPTLDLETKAALHELEAGVRSLGSHLPEGEEQRNHYRSSYQHACQLREGIQVAKMQHFRKEMQTLAVKQKIPLQVRFPFDEPPKKPHTVKTPP